MQRNWSCHLPQGRFIRFLFLFLKMTLPEFPNIFLTSLLSCKCNFIGEKLQHINHIQLRCDSTLWTRIWYKIYAYYNTIFFLAQKLVPDPFLRHFLGFVKHYDAVVKRTRSSLKTGFMPYLSTTYGLCDLQQGM